MLPVLDSEAVGELRTVVGQHFDDLDRRSQLRSVQEVNAVFIAHVTADVQEHPACGAINGHKQITTRGLVLHLQQVFDIDMNKLDS